MEPKLSKEFIDLDQLMDAAGTEPVLRELMALYFPVMERNFADLRAAIAAGSTREVSRLAHSAYGSSANFGFIGVATPLRQMEMDSAEGSLRSAEQLYSTARAQFESTRGFIDTFSPASPPE